jgi:hypothetical protein
MRAAKFEFETWDDAFGKIPGKGTHRNSIQGLVKYAVLGSEYANFIKRAERSAIVFLKNWARTNF